MFDAALSPYQLGNVSLRNRIVTTAYVTNMADNHLPSAQQAAHYADIARGGAGLIVMAFLSVHPTAGHVGSEIHGWDPRIVPGVRAIAEAVHEHGTRLICQLGHTGRQGSSVHTDRALWAASSVPCPRTREMPKTMEPEDISEIIEAHAIAAALVKEAGADGAEIHSGYGGYLLSGFLSPYSNFRADEYGGSFENRVRLSLEVAHAVRAEVGPEFLVGIQVNGDDLAPGGLDAEASTEVAKRLAGDGSLDYMTVKAGTYLSADLNVPDMQQPPGLWLEFAANVKRAVGDFPVVAVGRVTDPEQADAVIADGVADLVAMTRQHISDPETVLKMREGRPEDIRKCVACNQGCIDYVAKGRHITCIHNPAAGYERELGLGTLTQAEDPRRVVVVGGGPAGMKAAEVAALRGHRVSLLEREAELGGQVRWAASVPGREEIGEVAWHLIHRLESLGIDIQAARDARVEEIRDLAPDVVIVATGSAPTKEAIGLRSFGITELAGVDRPQVLHLGEYFQDADRVLGERVAVVDDGEGGWKALSVATSLAEKGHETCLITPLPFAGAAVGPFSAATAMRRVDSAGLRTLPSTLVKSIEDDGVRCVRFGKEIPLEPTDDVVLAGWFKPREELYFGLKSALDVPVHRIGDSLASRSILQAVHEGERLARCI